MLKGQLSKVPWPGNIHFPACSSGTSAAPHSHSLQQAIHTQLAHHYIQQALLILSIYFSKRISSKYCAATSKHHQHKKGLWPHQSDIPSLFIPVAAMGKCKQINNSNIPYVSNVISLIIHERNYAISSMRFVTPASYSHSSSTLLHSIGFIISLCPRRFLQSTMWPHQSTARPLERAASHIKGKRPPCLFWFPPYVNVNRSTTVIHRM